jgi:hypothetical protein
VIEAVVFGVGEQALPLLAGLLLFGVLVGAGLGLLLA